MSFFRGISSPRRLADGTKGFARLGWTSETVTCDGRGRYTEASLRGQSFYAMLSVAAALANNPTTATSGMTLWNPIGSGIAASMLMCSLGNYSFGSAVTMIGMTAGYSSVIPPGIITNSNYIVGTTAIGNYNKSTTVQLGPKTLIFASCSGLANAMQWLFPLVSSAVVGSPTTSYQDNPPSVVDLGGIITLLPGAILSFAANGPSTSANIYLAWEETPL